MDRFDAFHISFPVSLESVEREVPGVDILVSSGGIADAGVHRVHVVGEEGGCGD